MQAARDVAQLEYEIAEKNLTSVQTRMDAGTATLHDLDDARSQASERFIALQDVTSNWSAANWASCAPREIWRNGHSARARRTNRPIGEAMRFTIVDRGFELPMSCCLRLYHGCLGNPRRRDHSEDNAQPSCSNQAPRKQGLTGPVSDNLNAPEQQRTSHYHHRQPRTNQF